MPTEATSGVCAPVTISAGSRPAQAATISTGTSSPIVSDRGAEMRAPLIA